MRSRTPPPASPKSPDLAYRISATNATAASTTMRTTSRLNGSCLSTRGTGYGTVKPPKLGYRHVRALLKTFALQVQANFM